MMEIHYPRGIPFSLQSWAIIQLRKIPSLSSNRIPTVCLVKNFTNEFFTLQILWCLNIVDIETLLTDYSQPPRQQEIWIASLKFSQFSGLYLCNESAIDVPGLLITVSMSLGTKIFSPDLVNPPSSDIPLLSSVSPSLSSLGALSLLPSLWMWIYAVINIAKISPYARCRNLLSIDSWLNRIDPSTDIIFSPNAEQGYRTKFGILLEGVFQYSIE